MKGIYVDTSKRDAAFLIQYHSDQPGNLLTVPGMQEILHAMEQCRADEEAKVLLFTGSGDFFCMGGFLGDCADKGSEEILRFADTLTALHRRMNRFPKPTVAVVNGHVGGGGLSFLETFDFAVSVPEAEYSLPEISNGSAPMLSILSVRNRYSRKLCMEMAGLGMRLNAGQALSLGLINRIAGQNMAETAERDGENEAARTPDVLEEALKTARRFAAGNLEAFGICKQYYASASGLSYEQQLEIGKEYLVTMLKYGKGGKERI